MISSLLLGKYLVIINTEYKIKLVLFVRYFTPITMRFYLTFGTRLLLNIEFKMEKIKKAR